MKKKSWVSIIDDPVMNLRPVDFCHKICSYRYDCHTKTRTKPPLEWCAGCKVKLYCMFSPHYDDVYLQHIECPGCGFSNNWEFPKCLCHGASQSGRLTFWCHGCGNTLFLGTGKWSKK